MGDWCSVLHIRNLGSRLQHQHDAVDGFAVPGYWRKVVSLAEMKRTIASANSRARAHRWIWKDRGVTAVFGR